MKVFLRGDQMLRVVEVREGCLVPVLAVKGHLSNDPTVYYAITSGVVLSLDKWREFKVVMGRMSSHRVDSGSWLLNAEAFRGLTKVDGITPERHFRWDGEDQFEEEELEKPVRGGGVSDPFLVELHREANVCSLEEMALIWVAFKQVALTWILGKDKILDLGFCKLGAVPYRPQWKETLAKKWPRIRAAAATEPEFLRSGVADDLLSRELLAMSKQDQTIMPHLECVSTESWEKASRGVEQTRLQRYNRVGYAENVVRRIQRLRDFARESIRSWAVRASSPFAYISKVGCKDGFRILPDTKSPRALPACMERVSDALVLSNKVPITSDRATLKELVAGETKLLS